MRGRTFRQALRDAQDLGLDRLDVQLLLLQALGRLPTERAWLMAHDDDLLPPGVDAAFHTFSLRRAAGEPLAYIAGYKEFFGLELRVDARVLVPRPDTETLVQWALDLAGSPGFSPPLHVLDLGTGSGAVALAIAHTLKRSGLQADVTAVDASADALEVAQGNAQKLAPGVHFLQSNWLEQVSGHFHLVVSNPPYIESGDPHMAALGHEPAQALVAGVDGLDDIRKIIRDALGHLHPGGWLLLEHGYDQAPRVAELLAARGFTQVQSRADLAGIARCSGGQWTGQNPKNQTAG